ncbi:PEP-CTERM-box response regulator transcription factor [Nibricoccus sp. IMCC34717]|uniref:PEP-CTERM-box response regulator transcription factor n=1 Tax=Nibricoccus sp. IMCC34717 TaxID=3034021 RepID=UPI00384A4A9F
MTQARPTLLIVDDDEEIRTQMKWALTDAYDVHLAEDRESALATFKEQKPQVVLLDLGLPPRPNSPDIGLEILGAVLAISPGTKVIVVSGQGEKENSMKAVGLGAYDFFLKPVDLDELKVMLRRAYHISYLEREYTRLQTAAVTGDFEGMLGSSPAMTKAFETIRKVATSDAPVLILGESGTGKEMAARAIHQRSNRRDGPFIAINCSAIPENLLESELFGHEKGAFTGAHAMRKGRIESAEDGTLFLDEIGDVPLPIQVKLLRFLQERTLERIGGRTQIEVDTRILAATNVDLQKAMAEGRFREDLFYRLAVVRFTLPPLRERDEDIRMVAQAFLNRFAAEAGKEGLSFTPDAIRALHQHSWPGNVRELQNRVRRAVIMSESNRLTADDLELITPPKAGTGTSLKEAREALERDMIQAALRKHNWKISPAANELGISRPTFYELMDKLGIQRPE